MVITELILGQLLNETVEKITKELKPKDVQTVQVKQDPDSYSITQIEKIKTTSQKWTNKDNANLKFKNLLEKESIVKEISLIPNVAFKTKGKIMITIDDVTVLQPSSTFDAYEDLVDTEIKINKTISQNSKIKVFVISSDGTEVGVTLQVTFGE